MKKIHLVILLLLTACGGQLSKEERARLREGMATQEIRRVTDAELHEAGLALATGIMADVEKVDRYLLNKARIDSLGQSRGVVIYALKPDAATQREIEQKLIEAYTTGANAGSTSDNLQNLGNDSLLFTRAIFELHPDGSQAFSHAIGIRIAKKTVVLSLPQP